MLAKIFSIIILLSSVLLPCAVCYGNPESPMSHGMNMGVLTLLGFIGFILCVEMLNYFFNFPHIEVLIVRCYINQANFYSQSDKFVMDTIVSCINIKRTYTIPFTGVVTKSFRKFHNTVMLSRYPCNMCTANRRIISFSN